MDAVRDPLLARPGATPGKDYDALRRPRDVDTTVDVLVPWFLDSPPFRLGVDAFLLVHAGLHLFLSLRV